MTVTHEEWKTLEAFQAELHAVNRQLADILEVQKAALAEQEKQGRDIHQVKGHLATLNGRVGKAEARIESNHEAMAVNRASITRNREEIFGDATTGTVGLKPRSEEVEKLLQRLRGAILAMLFVTTANGGLFLLQLLN